MYNDQKYRLNLIFSIIQVKIYETSFVIILMLSLLENDRWISFSAWRSLSSHLINLISFLCDCMHLFKFFPLPKLITLKGICCHIYLQQNCMLLPIQILGLWLYALIMHLCSFVSHQAFERCFYETVSLQVSQYSIISL